MNEGKPTKAPWWSRRRPHGPSPDTPAPRPPQPDASAPLPSQPGAPGVDVPVVGRVEDGDPASSAPRPPQPGASASLAPQPDASASLPSQSGALGVDVPVVGRVEDGDPAFTAPRPPQPGASAPRPPQPDASASLAPQPDASASLPSQPGAPDVEDGAVGRAEDGDPGASAPDEAASGAARQELPGLPGPRPPVPSPPGADAVDRPAGECGHEPAPAAVPRREPRHEPVPRTDASAAHPGAPHPAAPGAPSGRPDTAHDASPAAAIPAQAPAPTGDPEPEDPRPPHPAGEGGPEATAPDPWRNYDPWAAPAPLQQNGAAVPTAARRRSRTRRALLLAAVALALVSGGVGGVVGAYLQRDAGAPKIVLPQAAEEPPGRAADSVAGIAAHALPSVVTLHVRGSEEEGTGTGFVLDTRGHILTNDHVIDPAGDGGEISVTFSGGETARAEVVGHDSGYDLAVVRVSGVSGLAPMPLGNSDSVQVGDPVVAIGAPFDLANTVTSGIISAKERPITAGGDQGDGTDVSYVDALQTDAPINPGNSGGPLLDARARVIGINSAIRSADSETDLESGRAGSIGLGFAIPVNQAKRVAEELINTGRATHPVIGVTLDMNYAGDGARVGLKSAGGGLAVTPGGPGARAGIAAGDVITEVDGTRVHSGEELIVRTRAHRPGDRLRLTLRRGGAERTVTLVLGSSGGD
ncbi:trypsin-like peptidase domain-containing protein [Streptomyces sp. NPDC048566]|uniref:S1C family serine protease n=1 Tax=Streptomyces sp. NPDC048566 TaxID=3365569 RepID=UPI0037192CCC